MCFKVTVVTFQAGTIPRVNHRVEVIYGHAPGVPQSPGAPLAHTLRPHHHRSHRAAGLPPMERGGLSLATHVPPMESTSDGAFPHAAWCGEGVPKHGVVRGVVRSGAEKLVGSSPPIKSRGRIWSFKTPPL